MHLLKSLVLGLFLITIGLPAFAQSTLQLINNEETTHLSDKVKVLAETDIQLSIDDVRQRRNEFIWHSSSNPNYGIHTGGLWLRTSLNRVSDIQEWVIDIGFAHMDRADFYLFAGDELIASNKQGKLSSAQFSRFPAFKVNLPLATPVDLYVRIESKSMQVIAPLDIQPYEKYMRMVFWDNLIWGLFYGGLLILALYNLILYLINRELSLLAFVGYILAVITWQFVWGGHSILLFPYEATLWLTSHMDLIFVLVGIASGIFTYMFLEAKRTAFKTAPFIKTNIGVLVTMGFCSLISLFPAAWQNAIVYLVTFFAIASFLVAGIESYSNKFNPARYFIAAWLVLIVSALVSMTSLTGFLPTNMFTTYCLHVGLFIQAGLFSIAMMDKSHNQLEREIQQATNDLRNNMEFIEEQNARLDIARKDAINASTIKSQFLANMSHEIRTPLNAILGFSKELIHTPLPVDKQEHVRIINSAADTLLNIVNDVLDVSKIEAGKLQLHNQPFCPNDVLEEMVSVMARSAHNKKLEFIYELTPLPEQLEGDAQRIKQILTNLLGNALKFTPSGHISLLVTGKLLPNNMYELNFNVEDTGIGISQEDRKKLFNAFSQIEDSTSRTYQGTGLGLVICQQLVHLMGGKITLTSDPGKGSCFRVTISTKILDKSEQFARNIGWAEKKVLLLDTDALTTNSASKMLENTGAKVTLAHSIKEFFTTKQDYDSLFVCLPESYLTTHVDILTQLTNVRISNLIILYSGDGISFDESHQVTKPTQLRLPLTLNKLASLTQTPIESHHNQIQQNLLELPKVKILAVDDMEMNLRLLSTWLNPSHLELSLAYSGEEAVNLCNQEDFDIILMDVQMPIMDGLQASRLIRKSQLNLGTPIIAVTAHALKEEQDRLLASGMDDYLPKPLDLEDLIVLIKRWCNTSSSATECSSVDWSMALKIANQDEAAAKDMLSAFVAELPDLITQIEDAWKITDKQTLKQLVHKLHGACLYTGVPMLLDLCDELETAIKLDEFSIVKLRLPSLIQEAKNVITDSEAFA
ncbi:7TM diverse intracellular signaling domain-containing protein [Aliiglaciecola sp. 2_MG-2023]|uniref:hybrid sensor histidine kinase/response regulator n=1 Tax=unclassified Aliiglaciecola TaxID=2593648 RepID=UPI0026E2A2D5|nr:MULTISPECIES: hybrid sensor histidine kinase/response regulator [unclassified Aliiglaciecola]MDO6709622.1 7TM diverse intracellular signaling domain-containing protein [Aliiglaciecola sp. 2_MG-2023]MDO6750836.1 7TM diverse intracellular signaling domain-containing protein [Aliiglaciecola sp. 1_MG-2023]